MSESELRVAVVGTGAVSREVAADLALTRGATLAAVCSRSAATARAFVGDRTDVLVFSDFDACVAHRNIDLVYLGTPHATHHDLALRAIKAGKGVIVEKPMALDSAQVGELVAAARSAGVFLMEGMWTKFNEVVRRVQGVVAAGTIGEVRSVRASFGIPFPTDTGSRWRADLGGSALLDQGIYPLTFAHLFLGEPTSLVARGTVRPDGIDVTEHLTLEYSGGRFAQLASSMVEFIDLSASINGTRGWITVDAAFWTPERATVTTVSEAAQRPDTVVIDIPRQGHGFVPMLEAVAEAVAAGELEHPLHPLADTVAVFALLDEARAQLSVSRS